MTYSPRGNYPQPKKRVKPIVPQIRVTIHRATVTVTFIGQ